jgi:hypothetical protein
VQIRSVIEKLHKKGSAGTATFTTAPVAASWGADPEFVDFRGLQSRFGIKRSLAYLLIADGAIKSVSLRRRGALKGKRLIDVESVRQFLKASMR